MSVRYCLIVLISLSVSVFSYADTYVNKPASQVKPALQLARVYSGDLNLSQYWVSEKLDGVRGYWNGMRLLTRQGHTIKAPEWFVAHLPAEPLDGELWIARGLFDQVSGIVRSEQAADSKWRQVKYMLFDLPDHQGTFDARLNALKLLIAEVDRPWIQLIPQRRIASEDELFALLDQVVADDGEGLMLHRDSSLYQQGRTNDLLKLKHWLDAEAQVIAQLPGKGKFTGMLGALLVETPEGIRFKLGSGFTDKQRENPPEIGSFVTYKYTGKTTNGVPRFASFMRVYQP
ncbi:MAG: DNA ligase [Amphritea sp.]